MNKIDELQIVKTKYRTLFTDSVIFNYRKVLHKEICRWEIVIEECYLIADICPITNIVITSKAIQDGKVIYKHSSRLNPNKKMDLDYYNALRQRFNYLVTSGEMEIVK